MASEFLSFPVLVCTNFMSWIYIRGRKFSCVQFSLFWQTRINFNSKKKKSLITVVLCVPHYLETVPVKVRVEFVLEQPRGGVQFISPSGATGSDALVSLSLEIIFSTFRNHAPFEMVDILLSVLPSIFFFF